MRYLLVAAALAGTLGASMTAQAQTTIIEQRTVGVAPGEVLIGEEAIPRFRRYVVEERIPSYAVEGPIAVGTVLPDNGVTYYDVPQTYGATPYRYTVVNQRAVLVDPRSRRIMQVVD
jgi:hypothetical protein